MKLSPLLPFLPECEWDTKTKCSPSWWQNGAWTVFCVLSAVWCGWSDFVPGHLELVASETWLVLLFSIKLLGAPEEFGPCHSHLTQSPCSWWPFIWTRGCVASIFLGCPGFPFVCSLHPLLVLHRKPCTMLKTACKMPVFFKGFAFFKASLLRSEGEVPLSLDSSSPFECFCSHLQTHLGFGPFEDSQNTWIWIPSLFFSPRSSPAPLVTNPFFPPHFSELGVTSHPELFLASFPCCIFQAVVLPI